MQRALSVLVALSLLCALARAGQALHLNKEQADEAVAFLRAQKQVVLYCAEPDCPDNRARSEKVARVESRKQGAHWQILLNGKRVDASSIYFLEAGAWFNLAIRQGLLVAGVPEQLPVPPGGSSADCAALAGEAERNERRLIPVLGFKVMGPGRLHFHGAPDGSCRDPKVFVIPGDSLTGYSEYKGWTRAMYVNRTSGQDFHGWVPDARVKAIGTMAPR